MNDNERLALLECLTYALRKSQVRGFESAVDAVILNEDAEKTRSSVLGEYLAPTEEYPNGRIVLHVDAIKHYSEFIGRHFVTVTVKIFFSQVHNALSYRSKKKFNYMKAEVFANRICNNLARQGILDKNAMPPKFYIDAADPKMYYHVGLRQEWIKRWTGMELQEVAKALNIGE